MLKGYSLSLRTSAKVPSKVTHYATPCGHKCATQLHVSAGLGCVVSHSLSAYALHGRLQDNARVLSALSIAHVPPFED